MKIGLLNHYTSVANVLATKQNTFQLSAFCDKYQLKQLIMTKTNFCRQTSCT
jgi:hypothetical protein